MLTKMTDADWVTVLKVFEASRDCSATGPSHCQASDHQPPSVQLMLTAKLPWSATVAQIPQIGFV